MSKRDGEHNLRPLNEWMTQSLRVTAFTTELVSDLILRSASWWDSVVSELPETKVENPKTSTLRIEGPFGSGSLVLSIENGRVDWQFSATINPDEGIIWMKLTDALNEFALPMLEWCEGSAPATSRLAFGAVVHLPVQDRERGYLQLQSYLPYVEVDPQSSDFFYQVNRHRVSKVVPGLRINRLGRWNVGQMSIRRVAVSAEGNATINTVDQEQACRVETDINCAPQKEAFSPQNLRLLCKELSSISSEVIEVGDRK
jgi:hypothetical protein